MDPIEYQRHEATLSALAECRICQGRIHGDCSDECRYFELTASEKEMSEAYAARHNARHANLPGWIGPVKHDEKEENAA